MRNRATKDATKAIKFIETLIVPEGKLAGKAVKLAPYQKDFIKGALNPETEIAILSIGRGNGKSAISAGLALGSLLGIWDSQPSREIIVAAKTRDQAGIIWKYVIGFVRGLSEELQSQIQERRSPRLEIEFTDDDGISHTIKCIAADGKSILGTSPTLVIMDERGHWAIDKGNDLEAALLSGLGKRDGKALIISTSASDDTHPFSQWLDNPQEGYYIQEHRPSPNLPVDDEESLLMANPGCKYGIGFTLEKLKKFAELAALRGGDTLANFRLYNRNERVSGESRDVLLTVDEWLECETETLPAREGQVIIGVDIGGSASMSAAAFYWFETGRLEVYATFPSNPNLSQRGAADGVSQRYVTMNNRGELSTLGDKTVPITEWMEKIASIAEGQTIAALVADRYKQAELSEGIDKSILRCPVIWRGFGFRDGGEDCERFRRAVYDGKVNSKPSLLLRSAFADAVTLRDPSNNMKLAKARSLGRIDAASASVIAVAEGARRMGRPSKGGVNSVWV